MALTGKLSGLEITTATAQLEFLMITFQKTGRLLNSTCTLKSTASMFRLFSVSAMI
jgi:hypothetical protein